MLIHVQLIVISAIEDDTNLKDASLNEVNLSGGVEVGVDEEGAKEDEEESNEEWISEGSLTHGLDSLPNLHLVTTNLITLGLEEVIVDILKLEPIKKTH